MYSRNFQRILYEAMAILFFATVAGYATAQVKEYPEKQIEIIIGFSPGGPIDVSTRILAEELKKELKVPIILGYKPGSGGAVANLSVIHSKPDGYTLLSQFDSSFINLPAMEKTPTYDPINDLTPIAICAINPSFLTANSSSKLTSFDVMVNFAKENPGKLNCSTSGIATSGHLTLELFKNYGIRITHIPCKGAAPAVIELLGNHVDLAGTALPPIAPHIRSGQLRPLVVTTKLKQLPEVPTWAEVGFPEFMIFGSRLEFLAPANLPKPILTRLSAAFEKVMQLPSVVEAMEKASFIPTYMGPEESREMVIKQYKTIKELAKTAGFIK